MSAAASPTSRTASRCSKNWPTSATTSISGRYDERDRRAQRHQRNGHAAGRPHPIHCRGQRSRRSLIEAGQPTTLVVNRFPSIRPPSFCRRAPLREIPSVLPKLLPHPASNAAVPVCDNRDGSAGPSRPSLPHTNQASKPQPPEVLRSASFLLHRPVHQQGSALLL